MRAFAIINPIAGGGRALRVWPGVRTRLLEAGWQVDEATAQHRGHEVELAAAAARQERDVVLAVGGDGTVHWTVNGLLARSQPRPALAVIPAGTGSDFAAAVDLPPDPQGAVEAVLAGTRRRVDVGLVHGRYFLTIATVGFGGEVARQVSDWSERLPARLKTRLPGPAIYLAGILKMLVVYSPVEMEVTLNGLTRRRRLFMLGVGNTCRAAGGMRLCPTAVPDDGLFEVLPIGDVTKLEVLRLLPQTFSGRHVTHPKVEVEAAATVTVASDHPLTIQADGELIGHVPATFITVPGALEVLSPPSGRPIEPHSVGHVG
ncbi:MAG: diacylglycerol kinase family lipid kinase [Armatimonadota bacterium]|nr:diacylglycerol kinase family lipid kinase [Armatimonadota bacterium]MDR7428214.1 diacylglycerol kinase family lipid kinase [Armatimonadota bacterium]MDR7464388.1 diacylglycerol kinase family lipid kinase [Armatimonadota bacterium]MDR7470726.1 diacylglycerol kinase family lipid kinase [Armatimonadota bacterium]MDR7475763.1 diacylglycerol kinase family lipid kinase [Armatimonadota bacterium]